MSLEAIKSPVCYRWPGGEILLQPGRALEVPDERARLRLVSKFDLELTKPEWALGYRFDIVLRGRDSTPFEGRT